MSVKSILALLSLSLFMAADLTKIYTFSSNSNVKDWFVVNDGVMGGISQSSIELTGEGYGCFSGRVSLVNNGGFASIQKNTSIQLNPEHKYVVLRIKGDGKSYEFRLKGSSSQYESYVHYFTTSGEWEIVRLKMEDFYPQFRGRKLSIPNFNFPSIAQMSFLIANKKEENFELLIDWIALST